MPTPLLSWAVAEAQGKRPYMEDRSLVVDDMGSIHAALAGARLLCVLDGHGGSRCADFAVERLPSRLAAALVSEAGIGLAPSLSPQATARHAAPSAHAGSPLGSADFSNGWMRKRRQQLAIEAETESAAAAEAAAEAVAAAVTAADAATCGGGPPPETSSPCLFGSISAETAAEAAAWVAAKAAPPPPPPPLPASSTAEHDSSSSSSLSSSAQEGSGKDADNEGSTPLAQPQPQEVEEGGGKRTSRNGSHTHAQQQQQQQQQQKEMQQQEGEQDQPTAERPLTTKAATTLPPSAHAASAQVSTSDVATAAASSSSSSSSAPAALASGAELIGAAPGEAIARAFGSAFASIDDDFLDVARQKTYGDGATILCALLRGRTLDVANLGDTRAVLGRRPDAHARFAAAAPAGSGGGGGGGAPGSGRSMRQRDVPLDALRLSVDHKPNLPLEAERVSSAGGTVKNVSGCWRVAGPSGCSTMLAVSRALGDRDLKDAAAMPLISCSPDTISHELGLRDRLLILASDGLWDVLTDAQAIKIAMEAARRARSSAPPRPPGEDGTDGADDDEGGTPPVGTPPMPLSSEEQIALSFASADPLHRAWVVAWQRHVADAAAKTLVRRAMELGSLDNVTVLVAWIDWVESMGP